MTFPSWHRSVVLLSTHGGLLGKPSFWGFVSNRLQSQYGFNTSSWKPQTLHNPTWFNAASLILPVFMTNSTWHTTKPATPKYWPNSQFSKSKTEVKASIPQPTDLKYAHNAQYISQGRQGLGWKRSKGAAWGS